MKHHPLRLGLRQATKPESLLRGSARDEETRSTQKGCHEFEVFLSEQQPDVDNYIKMNRQTSYRAFRNFNVTSYIQQPKFFYPSSIIRSGGLAERRFECFRLLFHCTGGHHDACKYVTNEQGDKLNRKNNVATRSKRMNKRPVKLSAVRGIGSASDVQIGLTFEKQQILQRRCLLSLCAIASRGVRKFAKRKPTNCIAGHGAEIQRCGANKQAKARGEAAELQNAPKEQLKDAAESLYILRKNGLGKMNGINLKRDKNINETDYKLHCGGTSIELKRQLNFCQNFERAFCILVLRQLARGERKSSRV
ncbi:hypothetical protein EAG_04146 [Camponotus floridanus]|uniref:Uncharacterized protein n=1 Tax=Camponotus floridanus TaxID=104421 RepID=E2AMR6_CAMFO|nr:hypothetical protein EAG_04146 [Camponotus floridanus]